MDGRLDFLILDLGSRFSPLASFVLDRLLAGPRMGKAGESAAYVATSAIAIVPVSIRRCWRWLPAWINHHDAHRR
jgi:hypothetical protein